MKARKILLGSMLILASFAAQQSLAGSITVNTATSVKTSKHDLSASGGLVGADGTAGTAEVCVYCHTPHGSDQATGPLWNRKGQTTAPTAVYSNPDTMDGEVLATFASSSAACMTCHDGATALDSVINKPGTDGYTASAGVWANTGAKMAAGIARIGAKLFAATSASGGDLSDDHPIGVAYCGGGFAATTGACKDSGFVLTTADGQTLASLVKYASAGNKVGAAAVTDTAPATGDKFWIDTDATTASRSKQDLTLFVRTTFASGGPQPSVECATCHDVHNNANKTFLRVPNSGSQLCFACHNK